MGTKIRGILRVMLKPTAVVDQINDIGTAVAKMLDQASVSVLRSTRDHIDFMVDIELSVYNTQFPVGLANRTAELSGVDCAVFIDCQGMYGPGPFIGSVNMNSTQLAAVAGEYLEELSSNTTAAMRQLRVSSLYVA